jgi:uncharacterized zinc-type alcohol dehydrogenase-like protein
MLPAKGYAALTEKSPIAPFEFERRSLGPKDVLIDIKFCGICHSDIHQARAEWGPAIFPMVPGHEIVGIISKTGAEVSKFKVGDAVGVGCFVDSCRTCPSCKEGLEQYCDGLLSFTYNGTEQDGKTPTYGGYSNRIVVDQNYLVKVPSNLDLAAVAPLLCAGITTYSPLRTWGVTKGQRVAVLGLGGLGHMGVKFAAAFGAEVTVLSSSPAKEKDAKRLGAHHFELFSDEATRKRLNKSFDLILDTVSAPHDINAALGLLKRDGTLVLVGVPPEAIPVAAFSLIPTRRRLVGSMIGGIKETQEMLDYCGKHSIVSDIELVAMKDINTAYERTIKSDVRYRFVLDLATL